MVDSEAKCFTGLGSTTGTPGRRKLPFCLSLDKGHDTLAGVMESHEVDTAARNPFVDIPVCSVNARTSQGHVHMHMYHSG